MFEHFSKLGRTASGREPSRAYTPNPHAHGSWRFSSAGVLIGLLVISLFISAGAALVLLRQDQQIRGAYVIGTNHSPPFQIVDADGNVSGALVEAVTLAAKNLGIHLEWRAVDKGPDFYLPVADSGIHLWPLVMHLPERKDKFYISEPFAQSQYVLVSKQAFDKIPEDIPHSAVIGHIAFPHIARYFQKEFPGRQAFPQREAPDLIRAVCEEKIDAAAVEANTLDTFLRSLPKNCGEGRIHARSLPGWRIALGVGSRFGYEPVADAIRAEIGRMARSGDLDPVFDRYFAYDRMRNRHLFTTTRQEEWTSQVMLVMSAFVILVIALAITVYVQRRRQRFAFAAAEAKAAFLAAMSHEIRTPLNGVLGLADLLADSGLSAKQASFVGGIQSSGKRLLTIVNDVLVMSSLESGRMQINPQQLALRPLIADVLNPLAFLASQKSIPVIVDIAPDVPDTISADSTKLSQVLTNLVGNAVKFTERGVIKLTVTSIPKTETTSIFNFSVEDTGIGIAPEDLGKVFEDYHRGSADQRINGTGLGLSISRLIVQLMGGILSASSEIGKGSRFWFDIPLHHPSAPSHQPPSPEFAKPMFMLVAVSPEPVQHALLSALHRHGIRTCSALADDTAAKVAAARQEGRCLVAVTASFDSSDSCPVLALRQLASVMGIEPIPTLQLSITPAGFPQNLPGIADSIWGQLICVDAIIQTLYEMSEGSHFSGIPSREALILEPKIESSLSLLQLAEHIEGQGLHTRSHRSALVADDNPINQQILSAMVRKLGIRSLVVADGEAAVRAVRRQQFDVILMDCRMPVMDGLQATEAIRAMEGTRGATPIIGVSADLGEVQRDMCLAAGMNDYVEKPFTLESIQAALVRAGLPCRPLQKRQVLVENSKVT